MSLQHIILNNNLVAGLFENIPLIADVKPHLSTPVFTAEQPAMEEKTLRFLGKNKKGICILVDYEDQVYLPDEQLSFLATILNACKLTLEDVAIVNKNSAGTHLSLQLLQQHPGCRYLIVFGIDPRSLSLPLQSQFSIEQVSGCTIIFSPPLETLNESTENGKLLKSKLWLCLKQLFT